MSVGIRNAPGFRRNAKAALARAEAVCADRGARFTRLRRKVLELIWASSGPSKAYDILDRLDDSIAASEPPTVYRTLDFLQAHGLVHKLDSLNAYVGCGHPLQHSECYFLFCSHCGTVEECCAERLKEAIARIARENRFKPQRTTLEIRGTCRRCRQEREK